ncbi:PREDICTED: LOW QUALITY PROTEIN: high mobility group protein B1-like [Cercocebus atys]|uniref:LOW QUALITY PROTEIN: high mobility group protein B1-like n=1 Tax=Cercocebus atys TaxID=9531 RepID=UPI0005F39B8A|nr:PREDICTED: LOW QUALITY PROTEIN: high mobility group protein B1-like [Cercocebus atys]
MGKGDPKKPRGKMLSYAFPVQTCEKEHKKLHETPSQKKKKKKIKKKCSARWKTMSAKEKGKFEDTAKANKARYEREMKIYIPPKRETKKKFKSNAPKRPPAACFVFCSECRPQIKEHLGLSIGDVAKKLGDMWNSTAADDKQPYEKKTARLKEKYKKDLAAYELKGKPDAAKKGVTKAEKSKRKKEGEEDEEDQEEEEDEGEEDDDE